MTKNDVATSTIKIRDARANKRFYVDNVIIDVYGHSLGPYGLAMYAALCRHADNSSQQCYPRVKTLADETGMSIRKAHSTIKDLCVLGLLNCESGKDDGVRNIYTLLQVHEDPDEQKEYARALGYAQDAEGSAPGAEGGYAPGAEGSARDAEEYAPGAEECASDAEASEQTHSTNSPNKLTEGNGGAGAPQPTSGTLTGAPEIPDPATMTVKAAVAWARDAPPEAVRALLECERARDGPRVTLVEGLERMLNPQRENQNAMFDAVAWVLYGVEPGDGAALDLLSEGARVNIGSVAKKLRDHGVTVDDLREFVKWWRKVPWQGRDGGLPNPKQLTDMWP